MVRSRTNPALSTPKRDLLLDTAMDLFNASSYHGVGIEAILTKANLARNTLYHHFDSKDDLIAAAILRRTNQSLESLEAAFEAVGPSPRKRLHALFAWHFAAVKRKDFNGCICMRAIGEYPDPASIVHETAVRAKTRLIAEIERLLLQMELRPVDAGRLARQTQYLVDGAIAHVLATRSTAAITEARDATMVLMEQCVSGGSSPSSR